MPLSRLCLLGAMVMLSAGEMLAQRAPRTSEKYQDAELEIALTLPGDWTRVPQNPSTPWTAARFISDPAKVQPEQHATFRVIVLPQNLELARTKVSLDPGDPYAIRTDDAGQSSYAAFVEKTTQEINMQEKKFEVKAVGDGKSAMGAYQDFTAQSGWLHRRARVFEREGMRVAIEFSIQEPRKADLEPMWKEILASVRPYSAPRPARVAPDPWLSPKLDPATYSGWLALPAAKRRDLRTRSEELWSQAVKMRSHLPWHCSQSKRFTVVSLLGTAGNQYVSNLEVFAGFLDRVLGPLSDDKVRKWVLRICTDTEQRDVFEAWPGPTDGFTEIVMFSIANEEAEGLSYGAAQRAMFWTYLHDKNARLGAVLPVWLEEGLTRLLYYGSRVRGNEVDFRRDTWARDYGRGLAKSGDLAPLQKIVTTDDASFRVFWGRAEQRKIRADVECELAVAFLLAKEQPIPQLQNFLTRYLTELGSTSADAQSAKDKEERVRLLDAAHEKVAAQVFGADADVWRKTEKAYAEFVQG